MTKTDLARESIIKGYLNGKSYDDIAAENGTAKGTISNIINSWIEKIGIPDIKEIREFSIMLRKSGITIKQCVQSFRLINILSNFGIADELDSDLGEDISKATEEEEDVSQIRKKKIGERKKDYSSTSKDNFYYFIENIYNNCKKNRIESNNIIQWIADLLEFHPSSNGTSNDDLSRFENDIDEPIVLQEVQTIKRSQSERFQTMSKEREIQIPFISKINYYIQQEKSKVQHLDARSKKLDQEIKELEEQKDVLDSRVNNLQGKERLALTYLDWFKNLRKEILEIHGIKLEDEINIFAKAINDFKNYGHNAYKIVKDYERMESLREEMKKIQNVSDSIKQTRDDMLKKIKSLEERESYSKQSLDILLELRHEGFGFKELKQLKNTVIEIAQTNNISRLDAGKKFAKDIESQYDDKLGFETRINEIKKELKELEDQVPGYKEHLQSRIITSGALQYLYNVGVTDDDIINMVNVVTAYLNGNIIFNSRVQSENIIDSDKPIKRAYYWKSLINEIRNLGDINSQIRKQRSILEVLKNEIEELNSQRQKLNEQILLSGQLLNSLFGQLSYFIESLKQIIFTAQQLNNIFILYQSYSFIFVISSENSKDSINDNTHTDE